MKNITLGIDRVSRPWVSLLWAAMICLAAIPTPASAQPREVLTATAVSQRTKTMPGDKFAVAVIFDLEQGWHVWPNKPVLPKGMEDVVATPTVVQLAKDFAAPAGVRIHTDHAQWPAPHEISSAGFTGDPIKVLSHEGRVVVYVPITISADAKPGEVIIPFDVKYQACDDSTCIAPTTAEASVKFQIAAAPEDAANKAEFAGFKPEVFAELSKPAAAKRPSGFQLPATAKKPGAVLAAAAISQRIITAPGDQFAVAVVFDLDKSWHVWPNKPVLPKGLEDLKPIATTVQPPKDYRAPAGIAIHTDRAQWPAPHEVESAGFTGDPIKVLSLEGRVVVYVPITIAKDAKQGEVEVSLELVYQACDDSQCRLRETAMTRVSFIVGNAVQAGLHENEFANFKPTVFAEIAKGPRAVEEGTPGPAPTADAKDATPETSLFGFKLPDPTSPVGIAVLFIVSIIGGAIMNLTPCVLPVIPIKIMTLTQHAGADHGALRLGMWMALGIVAFWTALGVPVAAIAGFDPSTFIFGRWWVTFAIGVVIVIMGLGIMGMFNITLPQSMYAVNPKADSPWGSFVFGIMTAILGLPCFGFVAGGLLAAAATMPSIAVMSVFIGMGVGMAAPFLVLSAKPQLLSRMPRTGPASELVKQVMGLMLFAAAMFFVANGLYTLISSKPYIGATMVWWAPAFFLTLAGLWLTYRTFQITKKAGRRVLFAGVSVLLAGLSIAMAVSETNVEKENYKKLLASESKNEDSFVTGAWNHYTPARFEAARVSGKVIVADFTASWCMICKTLKKKVLDPDPVNSEIMKDDVVVFHVDCGNEEMPGSEFLRSLGRTGIPTLAIFAPGSEKPEIFNAYTTQTVMDALKRARDRAALASTK
jgi:thiol:disulfide interchange protein